MIKNTSFFFIVALIGLLVLSACGGSDEPAAESEAGNDNQTSTSSESQASSASEAQVSSGNENQSTEPERVRLSEDYANALSAQAQLALGTLQLEESDLAMSETAAAELLPLWQALQSLSSSETAAAVEIDAVVNQIQDSMTTDQIAAIAEMQLTEESLAALIEAGELTFGRGAFGGGGRGVTAGGPGEGGFSGGGLPGGGGRGQGGGLPGEGGFGELSADDRATRQAEFAEGGLGDIQDRLLAGVVVRLLQEKSGQAPERINIFDAVIAVISEEIGLSVEEIRSQTADGATLAELVEGSGGDLETVRALLIEAFNELPNAENFDAEQMATEWLGQ